MVRTIFVLSAQVLFFVSLGTAQEHGSIHHWAYEGKDGPAHWSSLDSTYQACGLGKQQSPIDIRGAVSADLPAIEFHYQPSPLKLVDNGHTVQVTYAPGSSVTIGDKNYQLVQFHFHHPAEETVNGKAYPLVAHLVHASADGHLAVIAVLFTQGQANEVVANVWQHLPAEKEKEATFNDVSVDANGLLPMSRGYYTFGGSLTTPPCTEGVTWVVMKTPVEVSAGQISTFAAKYPHNARPVQPGNGRSIQMTK
jgi:carbonic anhydrase